MKADLYRLPLEESGDNGIRTSARGAGLRLRVGDLLEALPDAMIIVNAAGRIVVANGQAERMFGYGRGELEDRLLEALLPQRFRDGHERQRAEYFKQPRVRPLHSGLELFGLRKDGAEFPVEISLGPLKTSEGTLVCGAIRDVTDRKRFERELQEKNLELAAANQAKDRFLAAMSHELRTPLNAILGFTGTLLMKLPGPLTDDQEKQLRTMKANAKHLLALIDDLLDLARIGADKVELRLETAEARQLVEEVASALRPQAESKGLEFEVLLPPAPVSLRTDIRVFKQILLNLTHNAIKFTDYGSVRLLLNRCEAEGRRVTEVRVEDTGRGIREENQARLFEAFTQLGSPNKRPQEGTGLGLHLCRKLAVLLGGNIDFQSQFGQGSTFTFILTED